MALTPTRRKEIDSVYYPPIAVVYAAYKQEQVGIDPNGFGILIPGLEKRDILGALSVRRSLTAEHPRTNICSRSLSAAAAGPSFAIRMTIM